MNDVFRLLRIAQDLSIKDFADLISVSPSYVSEIESGKKKPSFDMLSKYSKALGMRQADIMYLLEEKDEKNYGYQELLLNILQKMVGKMAISSPSTDGG